MFPARQPPVQLIEVLSGKFPEGLTTMIKGALNTVLGSSFGGEFTSTSSVPKALRKLPRMLSATTCKLVCWIWRRWAHRFSGTRSPGPLRRTRLLKSKNDLKKWVNSLRICTQGCRSLRCLRPLVRYLRWEGPRKCKREWVEQFKLFKQVK